MRARVLVSLVGVSFFFLRKMYKANGGQSRSPPRTEFGQARSRPCLRLGASSLALVSRATDSYSYDSDGHLLSVHTQNIICSEMSYAGTAFCRVTILHIANVSHAANSDWHRKLLRPFDWLGSMPLRNLSARWHLSVSKTAHIRCAMLDAVEPAMLSHLIGLQNGSTFFD